jgi:hypothetical protein
MPEIVLKTLFAALDKYDGDNEEIAITRQWLESLDAEPVLTVAEVETVKVAIAACEEEEAKGTLYSLEEVEKELREMIANFDSSKLSVKA